MSFENDRRRRIDRMLDLLRLNKDGLQAHVLYRECFSEITKQRFNLYLEEMSWAGVIVMLKDGRIKLK